MVDLHEAAWMGDVASVQAFLSSDTSPNIFLDERTPLHCACETGQVTCARLLIYAGAELEAKDWKGCTPLLVAADRGSAPIVAMLLRAGALIEARGYRRFNALHLAIRGGHIAVIKLLMERIASLRSSMDSSSAARSAVHQLNARCWLHRSPLHYAAIGGDPEMAAALLSVPECDVRARDQWDRTPLAYAMMYDRPNAATFIVAACNRNACNAAAAAAAAAAAGTAAPVAAAAATTGTTAAATPASENDAASVNAGSAFHGDDGDGVSARRTPDTAPPLKIRGASGIWLPAASATAADRSAHRRKLAHRQVPAAIQLMAPFSPAF